MLALSLYTESYTLMQLHMLDGTLYATTTARLIRIEQVSYTSVLHYFLTSGFRVTTAQAIAYGTLADREKTIALGKLVKLLANS